MWRFGLAGGSCLCAVLVLVAFSQERPRFGRGFGPGPVTSAMVLGMPEVQQELGLDDDKKQQAREWSQQTQQQLREALGQFNFQDLRDASEEERERHMADLREKSDEVMKPAEARLSKFLSPEQLQRLGQLKLQREGTPALGREDISRALKLTEKQRSELRDIPPPFPFGPPEARQQADAEAMAVLTEEQRKTWDQMVGKEFRFPEPEFGPGGPGGPGQERKIVAQFDKDSDGRLNREERLAAREFMKSNRGNGGGRGFGPGGPGGGFGPGGPGGGFGPGGPGGGGFGPPGGGPGGFGPGPGGPGGPGGRGPGGPGGPGGRREEPKPGPKVSPADVKAIPDAGLYEPTVLRTLFLDFEHEDWETEMAEFNNTDVEIPATVTVDGQKYPDVGVHFRGMSSFMSVGAGSKRSLNLTFDFVDSDQRLYGYKTLNLLNSHEDPSFLHTVLYLQAARQHIAAPKANFVKVVINGESWGVYVNAQQFNKEFINDNFKTTKGARWKVQGSPGGRGGLEYLGEDLSAYKQRYSIKTKDSEKDWKALAKLCKTLNETPLEQLEEALEPMLDVDGALWFLALENALINSDGYWIRASDYCIYRDEKGQFHIIPHDANETFQPGMGPGMGGPGPGGGRGRPEGGPPGDRRPPREGQTAESRPGERRPEDRGPAERGQAERGPGERGGRRGPGGPGAPGGPGGGPGGFAGGPRGGGGVELDPLVGLTDPSKPLRSRLLAVPKLKERYLAHVKTIANEWLDWQKLQPVVNEYVTLIDSEIKADTKKLSSYDAFLQAVSASQRPPQAEARPEGRQRPSLRDFADQRRQFLLNSAPIKESSGGN